MAKNETIAISKDYYDFLREQVEKGLSAKRELTIANFRIKELTRENKIYERMFCIDGKDCIAFADYLRDWRHLDKETIRKETKERRTLGSKYLYDFATMLVELEEDDDENQENM